MLFEQYGEMSQIRNITFTQAYKPTIKEKEEIKNVVGPTILNNLKEYFESKLGGANHEKYSDRIQELTDLINNFKRGLAPLEEERGRIEKYLTEAVEKVINKQNKAPYKGHNIAVFDGQNKKSLPGKLVMTSADDHVQDADLVAIFKSMEETVTYYKEVEGYDIVQTIGFKYDQTKSAILFGTGHYDVNYQNAFFGQNTRSATPQMVVGDGLQGTMGKFAYYPEIIAHELTHGEDSNVTGISLPNSHNQSHTLIYNGPGSNEQGGIEEFHADLGGLKVKWRSFEMTNPNQRVPIGEPSTWAVGIKIVNGLEEGILIDSAGVTYPLRRWDNPGHAFIDSKKFGTDGQFKTMGALKSAGANKKIDPHNSSGVPQYATTTSLKKYIFAHPEEPIWDNKLTRIFERAKKYMHPSINNAGRAYICNQLASRMYPGEAEELISALNEGWTVAEIDLNESNANAHINFDTVKPVEATL